MKKLYELLGLKQSAGDVGIEIECEGNNLQPVAAGGWRTEADNSLRGDYPHNSCEWVFSKPLSITDSLAALQWLSDTQKKGGAEFKFSFRTSVHVHVNVQRLTTNQIMNMLYTYFICERVMMNYCAPHRRGNRFCLRLEDAEGMLPFITRMAREPEYRWQLLNPHDKIRYSALNLEAMWKYGSLEFRGLEGNMDVKRIHNWASAFVNMREFAKQFNNIQDVHDLFVRSRPEDFFRAAVGGVYKSFVYDGYENDLRRGFSLTIDIPYAYEPVNEEQKVVPKAPKINVIRNDERPLQNIIQHMDEEWVRLNQPRIVLHNHINLNQIQINDEPQIF